MEDKRAKTQWEKSNKSYRNYYNYINQKRDKFQLTFIDLLYVSNFKGGNATINEMEIQINEKLLKYSEIFREIDLNFGDMELKNLNDDEIKDLIELVKKLCILTKNDSGCRIDGFSISYLSALLNIYFPNLLPILDRRVLINSQIITSNPKDKFVNNQGQVINIEAFYEPLILKVREKSLNENKTIRQIDQELFVLKIEKYNLI